MPPPKSTSHENLGKKYFTVYPHLKVMKLRKKVWSMKSFLGHTIFIEITQIKTEVQTLGTIVASIKILEV